MLRAPQGGYWWNREAQRGLKVTEKKNLEPGKYFVAAADFPRPFRKRVWQWKTIQGNGYPATIGCVGTWETARSLASPRFKVWDQCCGPRQAAEWRVFWSRCTRLLEMAFGLLKREILLAYLLVCFERRLAWEKRSERGQGSLRRHLGRVSQCGQEICKTWDRLMWQVSWKTF